MLCDDYRPLTILSAQTCDITMLIREGIPHEDVCKEQLAPVSDLSVADDEFFGGRWGGCSGPGYTRQWSRRGRLASRSGRHTRYGRRRARRASGRAGGHVVGIHVRSFDWIRRWAQAIRASSNSNATPQGKANSWPASAVEVGFPLIAAQTMAIHGSSFSEVKGLRGQEALYELPQKTGEFPRPSRRWVRTTAAMGATPGNF
jgi:hypothetical protein